MKLDLAIASSVAATAYLVPEAARKLGMASAAYVVHRVLGRYHNWLADRLGDPCVTLAGLAVSGAGLCFFRDLNESIEWPSVVSWPTRWVEIVFTGAKIMFYARCITTPVVELARQSTRKAFVDLVDKIQELDDDKSSEPQK
jgi:hypothetical protein